MTFDQIDRILREANPVPDVSAFEHEQRPDLPDETLVEKPIARDSVPVVQQRGGFVRGLLVAAVASAVILIGFSGFREGGDSPITTEVVSPAPEPNAELRAAQVRAVAVASDFIQARGDGDVAAALNHLAEDAVLAWGPGDSPATLEKALEWERAFGVTFTLSECNARGGGDVSAPIDVHCTLSQDSAIASALGNELEPACADILVEGDQIVRATLGCGNFMEAAWNPFRVWVIAKHRDDVGVMYSPGANGAPAQTTEESLALWKQYRQDFVAAPEG